MEIEIDWKYLIEEAKRLRRDPKSNMEDHHLARYFDELFSDAVASLGFFNVYGLSGFVDKILEDFGDLTEIRFTTWMDFIELCEGKIVTLYYVEPKDARVLCAGTLEQALTKAYNIIYNSDKVEGEPFVSGTTNLFAHAWENGEFKGGIQIT